MAQSSAEICQKLAAFSGAAVGAPLTLATSALDPAKKPQKEKQVFGLSSAIRIALSAVPKLLQEQKYSSALCVCAVHALLHCTASGGVTGEQVKGLVDALSPAAPSSIECAYVSSIPLPGPSSLPFDSLKPLLASLLSLVRAAVGAGKLGLAAEMVRGRAGLLFTSMTAMVRGEPSSLSWLQGQRASLYSHLVGPGSSKGGGQAGGGRTQDTQRTILGLLWLAYTPCEGCNSDSPPILTSSSLPLAQLLLSSSSSVLGAAAKGAVQAGTMPTATATPGTGTQGVEEYQLARVRTADAVSPLLQAYSWLYPGIRKLFDEGVAGGVGGAGLPACLLAFADWMGRYISLCRLGQAWSTAVTVHRQLGGLAQSAASSPGPQGVYARLLVATCALGAGLDGLRGYGQAAGAYEAALGGVAWPWSGAAEAEASDSAELVKAAPDLVRKGVALLQRDMGPALAECLLPVAPGGGAGEEQEVRVRIAGCLASCCDCLAAITDWCAARPLLSLGVVAHRTTQLAGEEGPKQGGVPGTAASSSSSSSSSSSGSSSSSSSGSGGGEQQGPAAPKKGSRKQGGDSTARAAVVSYAIALPPLDWWLLLEQASVIVSKAVVGGEGGGVPTPPAQPASLPAYARRACAALSVAAGTAARCRLIRLLLAGAAVYHGKACSPSAASRAWGYMAACHVLGEDAWGAGGTGGGAQQGQGEGEQEDIPASLCTSTILLGRVERGADVVGPVLAKLMRQGEAQHHLRKAVDHMADCARHAGRVGGSTGVAAVSHAAALLAPILSPLVQACLGARGGAEEGGGLRSFTTSCMREVGQAWEGVLEGLAASPPGAQEAVLYDALATARLPSTYGTLALLQAGVGVGGAGAGVGEGLYKGARYAFMQALLSIPVRASEAAGEGARPFLSALSTACAPLLSDLFPLLWDQEGGEDGDRGVVAGGGEGSSALTQEVGHALVRAILSLQPGSRSSSLFAAATACLASLGRRECEGGAGGMRAARVLLAMVQAADKGGMEAEGVRRAVAEALLSIPALAVPSALLSRAAGAVGAEGEEGPGEGEAEAAEEQGRIPVDTTLRMGEEQGCLACFPLRLLSAPHARCGGGPPPALLLLRAALSVVSSPLSLPCCAACAWAGGRLRRALQQMEEVPSSPSLFSRLFTAPLLSCSPSHPLHDRAALLAAVCSSLQTAPPQGGPEGRGEPPALGTLLAACDAMLQCTTVSAASSCLSACQASLSSLSAPALPRPAGGHTRVGAARGKWAMLVGAALLHSCAATVLLSLPCGMRALACALQHSTLACSLWGRAWRQRGVGLRLASSVGGWEGREAAGPWEGVMEAHELLLCARALAYRGELGKARVCAERAVATCRAVGVPLSLCEGEGEGEHGLVTLATLAQGALALVQGFSGQLQGCLVTLGCGAASPSLPTPDTHPPPPLPSMAPHAHPFLAGVWAEVLAAQGRAAVEAGEEVPRAITASAAAVHGHLSALPRPSTSSCPYMRLVRVLAGAWAGLGEGQEPPGAPAGVGSMELAGREAVLAYLSQGRVPCSPSPLHLLSLPSTLACMPWWEVSTLLLAATGGAQGGGAGSSPLQPVLVAAAAGSTCDWSSLQYMRKRAYALCAAAWAGAGTGGGRVLQASATLLSCTQAMLYPSPSLPARTEMDAVALLCLCYDPCSLLPPPASGGQGMLLPLALYPMHPTLALAAVGRPPAWGGLALVAAMWTGGGPGSAVTLPPSCAAALSSSLCQLKSIHAASAEVMSRGVSAQAVAEAQAAAQGGGGGVGEDAPAPLLQRAVGEGTLHAILRVRGEGKAAEAEAWWGERAKLDARMKQLLEGLSTSVLTPVWSTLQQGGSSGSSGGGGAREVGVQAGTRQPLGAREVQGMKLTELRALAVQLGIQAPPMKKQDLLDVILPRLSAEGGGESGWTLPTYDSTAPPPPWLHALQQQQAQAASASQAACHALLLSPSLHALPWESCAALSPHMCARQVGLGGLLAAGLALSSLQDAAGGHAEGGATSLLSSLVQYGTCLATPARPPPSLYYAVNPSGDLDGTQATLLPVLAQVGKEWGARVKGVAGSQGGLSPATAASLITSHALYVYCGHGSGELFLPRDVVGSSAPLPMPHTLLVGCSSGKLHAGHGADSGMYSCAAPYGAPISYLSALCPSLAVCLWDVTDRDIDRYTCTLLREGARQGARDKARAACKMQNLVGASVVWYGLPAQ